MCAESANIPESADLSEKDRVYSVETEISDLNPDNLLKPYAYLRLIAQISERHLAAADADIRATSRHNLAWVLISTTLQIVRPVRGYCLLAARTWYSGRHGPYFRREYVFRDRDGMLFQGSSFSVLLDMTRRTVFRAAELPFALSVPHRQTTVDAKPSRRFTETWKPVATRPVTRSMIDSLGHVNNTRYAELAYDLFNDADQARLAELRRVEIYFSAELRLGETIRLLRQNQAEYVCFRGLHDADGKPAFDLFFGFSETPNA